MTQSNGLIVVWMNVPEQFDEELHAWYETEHVPEIASLPGIVSVRRCVDPTHPLRFMAMFECMDSHVESGDAFKQMIERATPWTRRVRTLFGDQRRRGNYIKTEELFAGSVDQAPTVAWLVIQTNTDPQETGSMFGELAGCTRYRAFVQQPPPESFRPELSHLQLYDFRSLEHADAARQRCTTLIDASVSLRHAVGTPLINSPRDSLRLSEVWDAKQIARRMASGFTSPYAAAIEPAVRHVVPALGAAA